MGNRTVSKLRRNMLLKGGLDRAYGKRAVQKIVFRVFLYTLIFGLSFTMLYPLIKVLPAVLAILLRWTTPMWYGSRGSSRF